MAWKRPMRRRFPVLRVAAAIVVIAVAAILVAIYAYGGHAYTSGNETTTAKYGYTTTAATTSVYYSSTTSMSTATTSMASTITTSIAPPLNVPAPAPDSQIARQGASATINVTGVTGGTLPYSYQWLGAVMNVSSNFTASYGDTLCQGTAQSPACDFQTEAGQNTLDTGFYYLKLRVIDSSIPMQHANSSVAAVDVAS